MNNTLSLKRTIQSLLLSMGLLTCAAQAQWLSLHEDASLVTYTERGEILRTDIFVNVAEMLDYKQKMRDQQGMMFHSVVIRAQYNCRDNRVRTYTIDFHDERMAGGQIVKTEKVYSQWQPINPRSVEQNLKNFACDPK
ncbi:surface-adhesin E family protein [Zwartia sp.]|jgi:hypothetical protein|uniref:surface-adhesin E family protein n=1 Tax=Zwartia sp. TaxID=2978004 RepID=UPI003BAF8002